MTRRHPNPWTQQEAPKGLPGDRARRRKDPLLPSVPLPQIRGVSGAGATRGSRASGSDDGWWGGSSLPELGVGVRSSPLSLPTLPTGAQRAAQNRAKLRSLPLPPLRRAGAPRDPAPRPGESEDPCRGSARETPDSLLALQGELLPSKFREFLQRTGTECVRATPPTSSARQSKKSVSEHCQHLPRCPHCSFPSDLRGQSSYFQISLKKILLRRIPALGTLKRDRSQFITFKKANQSTDGSGWPFCSLALEAEINSNKCVLDASSPTVSRPPSSRLCSLTAPREKARGRSVGASAPSACDLLMRPCGTARSATGNVPWQVSRQQGEPQDSRKFQPGAQRAEAAALGPGSEGRPEKARNPLTLRKRYLHWLLRRVSEAPRGPRRGAEVLQRCTNVGGTREQPPWREQWVPGPGHHGRTSSCQGLARVISAHVGDRPHSLLTPRLVPSMAYRG
ncbi:uncharacterized protein C9orf50 homolog isoform X1 [Acinonyx jubatus]|uniref:Uncharacterized protein C9orf50 homolog isoform X1 n=1 Tax=Acinonyx jubatus TaxID=32536 RepID=A0ABM3NM25_ACIJB|nr:uncharacterized protein C9orf50 homolog isoform X1 [Acinonyx jubatus]